MLLLANSCELYERSVSCNNAYITQVETACAAFLCDPLCFYVASPYCSWVHYTCYTQR